jgi:regulatory protein
VNEIKPKQKHFEFNMSGDNNKTDSGKRRHKIPRRVSAASLENAALYYLGRFATSSENLRQVLERRIMRAAKHHNTDVEACTQVVGDLIRRYLESGILNDEIYAQTQAASMNRRGKSLRAIRVRLRQKTLSSDIIDDALAVLADEVSQPDLAAAIAYARKRRLGPYRRDTGKSENPDKELAALARSGFSYSLALRVVEAKNIDELENEL